MVAEYKLWFINGTDFYLQNSFLLPADSEALAWARVAAPLTSTHIQRHLDGQHTIGVYALTRSPVAANGLPSTPITQAQRNTSKKSPGR